MTRFYRNLELCNASVYTARTDYGIRVVRSTTYSPVQRSQCALTLLNAVRAVCAARALVALATRHRAVYALSAYLTLLDPLSRVSPSKYDDGDYTLAPATDTMQAFIHITHTSWQHPDRAPSEA